MSSAAQDFTELLNSFSAGSLTRDEAIRAVQAALADHNENASTHHTTQSDDVPAASTPSATSTPIREGENRYSLSGPQVGVARPRTTSNGSASRSSSRHSNGTRPSIQTVRFRLGDSDVEVFANPQPTETGRATDGSLGSPALNKLSSSVIPGVADFPSTSLFKPQGPPNRVVPSGPIRTSEADDAQSPLHQRSTGKDKPAWGAPGAKAPSPPPPGASDPFVDQTSASRIEKRRGGSAARTEQGRVDGNGSPPPRQPSSSDQVADVQKAVTSADMPTQKVESKDAATSKPSGAKASGNASQAVAKSSDSRAAEGRGTLKQQQKQSLEQVRKSNALAKGRKAQKDKGKEGGSQEFDPDAYVESFGK